MSKAHTPGPWRMTRHNHKLIKVENKDRVIFDGFHNEEANALLAAAAPEMLTALLTCITDDPQGTVDRGNAVRRLEYINQVAKYAIEYSKGSRQPSPI